MKDKTFPSLHETFPDWKTRGGGLDGDNNFKGQTAQSLPVEKQGEPWTLGPRNGGIDNPVSRVVTDFDELEAQRIKKFGAKVRFDLDAPLSTNQKTTIIDEDGKEHSLDKGKTEVTLGSYLSSVIAQGNKYIVENSAKIITSIVSQLNSGKVQDGKDITVKISKVIKTIDPSQEKLTTGFNYCTLGYYLKNQGELRVCLTKNAPLNSLDIDRGYIVRSLKNDPVLEETLKKYCRNSPLDILDIRNCRIIKMDNVSITERRLVKKVRPVPKFGEADDESEDIPSLSGLETPDGLKTEDDEPISSSIADITADLSNLTIDRALVRKEDEKSKMSGFVPEKVEKINQQEQLIKDANLRLAKFQQEQKEKSQQPITPAQETLEDRKKARDRAAMIKQIEDADKKKVSLRELGVQFNKKNKKKRN